MLYHQVRGEVRFERGTSMYLKRYQREWREVMALLATRDGVRRSRANSFSSGSLRLNKSKDAGSPPARRCAAG